MAFIFFMILFCAAAPKNVWASASIDISAAASGLARVQFTGDLSKTVKVLVDLNGTQNIYMLRSQNPTFIPLQMGPGAYKISVLQNVAGNKYKPLASQAVTVGEVDQNAMYSASIPLIDYNASTQAIPAYAKLTQGETKNKAVEKVYADVVTGYSYDFDKVKNLPADYVPILDEVYQKKKGICYDYSALLAGSLRSQGIPVKLVMGYAPDIEEYHAWNEIWIDGKWVVVDTTYDSQLAKANVTYTFAKDASKRKVVKVY
ncbi:MAG: transglutaminase-like domain-containing protein [Clostridiales bacterium]|jgi:transglutaminase-like putative cysteine protease|nr:transglutaminase-like domain-containing protein [Clostridiales bacterium]